MLGRIRLRSGHRPSIRSEQFSMLTLAQTYGDQSGPSTLERRNNEIARHCAIDDILNTRETGQAPRVREVAIDDACAKSVELRHLHAESIGYIVGVVVCGRWMLIIHD